MEKRASKNLRTKRKYLVWLKDAKGLSDASIDKASASISRYEDHTRGADFGAFHTEKARSFKRHLDAARNSRSGKPLSPGTIDGVLRDVSAFFNWLADQPGYRSRIRRSEIEFLASSRRAGRAAHDSLWKPHPSADQLRHVLRLMPAATLIERRDRAIVAFLFLTGSRDGAAITLRLKHLDLNAECVHFDGREVKTKFGKRFTTFFFPVGAGPRRIVADWVEELRHEKLFGPDDPLFPKTEARLRGGQVSVATQLSRLPWSTPSQVRRIFKSAFAAAGMPEYPPHRVRDTLAGLASEFCRTPEQLKAWSQNLGHDGVLTTLTSYGSVSPGRQAQLIEEMREEKQAVQV